MSDSSSDTSGSDSDSVFTSYGDLQEDDDVKNEIGRNEDWYLYSKNALVLRNTTKVPFKLHLEDELPFTDEWEFRDKSCVKCESEKYFQISFKLTPAKDSENVMMTICVRASKSNSRLEITRIETFSIKMVLSPCKDTASAPYTPIVKYAQIENAEEMMETIENNELENPEIFLSMGTFCTLTDLQKLIHVDQRFKLANEHNVPSGDFEPGSEYVKMDFEMHARFDVFFEPEEIKPIKCGDFEFALARHAIKGLGPNPVSWAKRMFSDNFTDAVFHVGEEDKDFPAAVKAHKSVLSARSPVFAAMYTTDMEEKTTGIVKLKGVTVEAMYAFLEYLYDVSPPEMYFSSSKLCLQALELAHKYQVPELVDACVRQLIFTRIDKLTVQDALGMYTLAHRFDFSDLLSRSLLFLGRCKEKFRLPDNKEALRKFMADENDIAPDLISSLFCHKNELWYEPIE